MKWFEHFIAIRYVININYLLWKNKLLHMYIILMTSHKATEKLFWIHPFVINLFLLLKLMNCFLCTEDAAKCLRSLQWSEVNLENLKCKMHGKSKWKEQRQSRMAKYTVVITHLPERLLSKFVHQTICSVFWSWTICSSRQPSQTYNN